MTNCLFDLNGSDLVETCGNVSDHVCDVHVDQLPNSSLPLPKHEFDWVTLGGIRRVEHDLVTVFFSKLDYLVLVNGGIVHNEEDVRLVERKVGEQFFRVRSE